MARSFASVSTNLITTTGTITPGNTGTICVWVKPSFNSGAGVQRYTFDSITTLNSPALQVFTDNNVYAGFVTGGNSRVIIADTGLYVSGTWAHWAFSWSVAAGQTLYVNGTSKGNVAYSSFSNSATGFYIGNTNAASASMFGSLADYAFWTAALSVPEITALAKGARPYTVRSLSLSNWYPLDGLQSPEPDLGGSHLNGTLTGTALASGPPLMQFTPRWPQRAAEAAPVTFLPAFATGKNVVIEGVAT